MDMFIWQMYIRLILARILVQTGALLSVLLFSFGALSLDQVLIFLTADDPAFVY